MTPDYGPKATYPSTGSYPLKYSTFSQRWHAQPTVLGADPLSTTGCDASVDSFGKKVWQADRDDGANPSVHGDTCAALNFTDYNRAEAAVFAAESSGDTKISTCE